ncbi:hypothetical protein ACQF36_07890 [Streptomyces sp. Marseille-Q5077]|uniref:hypothetical protein n=1 Tax=Streptomyces sp. Marseille-Q5077 TaxID=3418995 RepID=UPI003D0659C4
MEIAGAREALTGARDPYLDVPPGELRARVTHADVVLALVREQLTSGPADPRRAAPDRAGRRAGRRGRAGVIAAAALLCARSAVADADDVVATHRAAVGSEARTRLAEARRLLTPSLSTPTGRTSPPSPADLLTSDTLAQQAHALAEQDIRLHGNPIEGPTDDITGLAGALLGGVLLGGDPEHRPTRHLRRPTHAGAPGHPGLSPSGRRTGPPRATPGPGEHVDGLDRASHAAQRRTASRTPTLPPTADCTPQAAAAAQPARPRAGSARSPSAPRGRLTARERRRPRALRTGSATPPPDP